VARLTNRPLVVGLVLCVTLNAFEALAVITAMPSITKDLHGENLYGAAFSAYMLANIVSIVVSGNLADRHGPARGCLVALATFATGLALAAAAPAMWVVVVARALQGFGGGGLGATAYVGIARGFPAQDHARLFSLLSTAWVVPGLLAPAVAGWLSETFSWRWVFLGLLPLIPVLFTLTVPALRSMPAPDNPDIEPGRTQLAIAVAAGTALLVSGLQADRWIVVAPLTTIGGVLAFPALRRLMPEGFLRAAPGLPAAIGSRLLLSLAFFGVDTFIPFAVQRVHGVGSTIAGVSITVSSITWTAGAMLQARRNQSNPPGQAMVAGFGFLMVGITLTLPVAWSSVPFGIVFGSWAVAGLGMGLCFNASSVAVFADAPPGREGATGSQLQTADSLGFAIAGGIGGAILNFGARRDWGDGQRVLVLWLVMLAVATVGLATARRVGRAQRAPVREREPAPAH
jgi:MFS family permease